MKFIKYPSIEQFRSTVKQVTSMTRFQGLDEQGEAVYDNNVEMPTLTFTGTVKLHGTNAGVCYDPATDEVWAQSRSRNITVDKDNAGWAFFVESHKGALKLLLKAHGNGKDIVSLFGEWCGGNIQKGVAITGLDKMFVIFECKVGEAWVDLEESSIGDANIDNLYSISNFQTYSVDIDFEDPSKSVNGLSDLTLQVEEECPVGESFGVSGVGEGIVWSCTYKEQKLRFKVKGEKHSSSKVKKLVKVDVEKIENIDNFVEYAVTPNRLEQGIEQVFTTESLEVDIKGLGKYLKWVMGDVVKEEMDTMVANGLEPKDVAKSVSNKARKWFMERYV